MSNSTKVLAVGTVLSLGMSGYLFFANQQLSSAVDEAVLKVNAASETAMSVKSEAALAQTTADLAKTLAEKANAATLAVESDVQQALAAAKSGGGTGGGFTAEMLTAQLLANPEIVTNALAEGQRIEQERERAAAASAITDKADLIYASAGSPVMGNVDGDATIVEFFDYQCSYCKRAAEGLFAASDKDGNIRLVMKEFPILGPASLAASKAALAAKNQGKYDEMHMALINFKGRLNDGAILNLAREQGLDILKLQLDMDSPAVQKEIDETRALAQQLGINGTPAFVVNDTLVPGAVPTEQLMQLVADQRG